MNTLATFAQNLTLPLVTTGDSVTFLLIYGMKTTADNTYQGKTCSVNVTILATQYNAEETASATAITIRTQNFLLPNLRQPFCF